MSEGRRGTCLTVLHVQVLDCGYVRSLLANTKTLRQILEEAMSLLKMFWRAALPSTDPSVQNLKKVQDTHLLFHLKSALFSWRIKAFTGLTSLYFEYTRGKMWP